MSLGLEKVHELQRELDAISPRLSELRRRWKKAGAFKTKDRIQDQIDALLSRRPDIQHALLRSWDGPSDA